MPTNSILATAMDADAGKPIHNSGSGAEEGDMVGNGNKTTKMYVYLSEA